MPIGKLEPFDLNSKQWHPYIRRVKQYILLNEVKDELHVPLLITVVGEATYSLMCDLCSPDHPESKSLDDLVKLVADHLEPQRSEIAERHVFRLRRQKIGETLTEYLQNLKHLATTCNFGATLEENLRDQFVSGLASEAMRSRIFAEKSITYKEAVELALALEAAERHAEVSGATGVAAAATTGASGDAEGLHQATTSARRRGGAGGGGAAGWAGSGSARPQQRGGGGGAGGAAVRCWRCGKGHRPDRCRFAKYNCDECNQRGHLKVMCSEIRGGGSRSYGHNYVSECCDPEIRGRLGSLPTLSMSLGILLSYVAGNWLYWRYLAFFSCIFCVALFLLLLPLPESPIWLEAQGMDSSKTVKWLHLSSRATAVIKENEEKAEDLKKPLSLFKREVFFSSAVMKPLVVGFALLFFQQFSGIDAVIFFTVEIFKSAGSKLDAMTATITVGLVQLVMNGVSTMLVDRAGRRPLLMVSAAIMCVSMASMGAAFYFEFEQDTWLGYLPIASLVSFMVGFSLGFGGLPFLLLGELFPAHYRSQLSAMASAVNLLSMFTVIKTYHALDAVLTSAGTFWMYSCFCALAFVFVLFVVPETKGKSLAEIEEQFRGSKKKDHVNMQTISSVC